MKTLALRIEYDGTNYCGWQKQKNAVTIQQKIEESLSALTGRELAVVAGGRTDTGVHARGQVAHVKLDFELQIPEEKLLRAINSKLPGDIRIYAACIIDGSFHARFDAIAREYSYTLSLSDSVFDRLYSTKPVYAPDIGLLTESAAIFTGKHDFTTFSKFNADTKHYVCNVKKCYWKKPGKNCFRLRILSDRFVYGMVRSIVGAMLDIARGKRTLEEVAAALDKADRTLISPVAPPTGLVLEKIYYPKRFKLFS